MVVLILFILIISIKIKLQIVNLKVDLPAKNKKIINNESEILLKIYILRKIKIAQINLRKIDMSSEKFKGRINKLRQKSNLKKFKNKYNVNIFEIIKKINVKVEKMDLMVILGTEDAAITAIIVGIVAGLIGNMLKNRIKNQDIQKYVVIPNYEGRNILKIEFDGIFSLNMTNIIHIVKFLIKRRVDKNVRTSYRRSYAYGNE